MSCGEDAAFTKRLEANDKRIEVIGGSDKYMAVCRNCWHSNKEKGNFGNVTFLMLYCLLINMAIFEKSTGNRDFFRIFLSKFYGQDQATPFSTLSLLRIVIYRNQHLVALL